MRKINQLNTKNDCFYFAFLEFFDDVLFAFTNNAQLKCKKIKIMSVYFSENSVL